MTSFIASSIEFFSNETDTVTALLATSCQIMNSSVVPVILSKEDIWYPLVLSSSSKTDGGAVEEELLKIFCFSHTMQFTEKLRFHFYDNAELAQRVLHRLVTKGTYFSRTLQHLTILDVNCFHPIRGKLFNLRSIDLSGINDTLTDADLKDVCSFTQLEKLVLRTKTKMNNKITDDGIQHLSNLKSLRELDLFCASKISHLDFLEEGVQQLRILNLEHCTSLRDEAFDVIDFKKCLSKLTTLNLKYCTSITVSTFRKLCQLPNLINLSSNRMRTDCIAAICNCQYLRQLEIEKNENELFLEARDNDETDKKVNRPPASLESLLLINNKSNLEVLESLRLNSCMPELPLALFKVGSLPQLQNLELTRCYSLSNESFCAIAIMKSLRSLNISVCPNLSNAAFYHLITHLDHLETLHILYCQNSKFTCEQEETHLDHNNNSNNNNNNRNLFVNPTSSSSSPLKELSLSVCQFITDKGLEDLMQALPNLQSFRISSAEKITCDGGFKKAFESSRRSAALLEKLFLRSCRGVKSLSFIEHLESLKELTVANCGLTTECNNVPKEFVEPLRKKSKVLEVLNLSDFDFAFNDGNHINNLVKNLFLPSSSTRSGDEDEDWRRLRILNLHHCNFPASSLDSWVSMMPNLEILQIENTKLNYTVRDVVAIVKKLPRLKCIEVNSLLSSMIRSNKELMKIMGHVLSKVG